MGEIIDFEEFMKRYSEKRAAEFAKRNDIKNVKSAYDVERLEKDIEKINAEAKLMESDKPLAVNDANKERVKPDGTVKAMWHLLDWGVLADDVRVMMFG